MPKRARSKSAPHFRAHKRRKMRRALRRAIVHRIPRSFGIPEKKIVEMEYFGYLSIPTGGTGGSTLAVPGSTCTWRMNSPYDPQYASTGTFNLVAGGYQLWSKLFGYYTVLGSKLVVDIHAVGASTLNTQPIVWMLKLDNEGSISGFTQWYQLVCDRNTRYGIMYHNTDNSEKLKLVCKFSPKKFFGLRNPIDSDTTGANVGGNPQNGAYAVLAYQSIDAVNAVNANAYHSVTVRLKMRVLLTKRRDVVDLNTADAIVEG